MYLKNLNLINVFLIVAPIVVVFWGIVSLDFQMQWDDYWVVMNSYTDKGFTFSNLVSVITDFYHSQYAPVNELYYMLINALFGYDPLFFHLGSLAVHIANSILVYRLILDISSKAFHLPALKAAQTALMTTLVFALHPFNLEAVAWIAASKILLYSFFYLVALILYIKYADQKKSVYFVLSVLFFIVSFGAKEQAVTFPLCTLLIDYLFKVRVASSGYWIEKSFLFATSLWFGLITIHSQGDVDPELFGSYSIPERFVLAFFTLFEYITKCLLPIKLSYVYPFPFAPGDRIPWWLFIYPVTLLITFVLSFKKILTNDWLLFGILFFIIHIVIGLHLISLARHSVIADRYSYISTVGIGFLISHVILNSKMNISQPKFSTVILVFYILFLSVSTRQHLPVWKNSQTLKKTLSDQINNRDDFKQLQKRYVEDVD